MGYYIADVDRLKQEVIAEIPNAKVETWRDYGFALDVSIGDRCVVACQPVRPETEDYAGQPEIFLTVPEIKRLLTLQ